MLRENVTCHIDRLLTDSQCCDFPSIQLPVVFPAISGQILPLMRAPETSETSETGEYMFPQANAMMSR